jgi:tetratricopeptide (TPR) repeat protein
VHQDIAREISERLRLRLSSADGKLLDKQATNNVEAYQFYLKGLYLRNKGRWLSAAMQYGSLPEDFEKIPAYFQQAIDLDPSYALAYAALAHYYGFAAARGLLPPNEAWPKAEALATKALELDPTLGDQYYHLLAALRFSYYRDWPTAERAFQRAIELNPNEAEIRQHYASSLMVVGRVDDARTVLRRSQELDPLSARFAPASGVTPLLIAYWSHQPDELIEGCRKRLGKIPSDVFSHDMLGNAFEQKGMYPDAVTEWRTAMTLSHDEELATILDRANADSGYEGVVRAVWQERLQRLSRRAERGEYVAAARFAGVYAKLGDEEQALAWLDTASEERNRLVLEAGIDPVYDGFRSDPGFVDLLRRIHLTP